VPRPARAVGYRGSVFTLDTVQPKLAAPTTKGRRGEAPLGS